MSERADDGSGEGASGFGLGERQDAPPSGPRVRGFRLPPPAPTRRLHRTTITLEADLFEDFRRVCLAQGYPMSRVLEAFAGHYVAEHQPVLQALRGAA